jgi:hypothetical protein
MTECEQDDEKSRNREEDGRQQKKMPDPVKVIGDMSFSAPMELGFDSMPLLGQ